MTLPPEEFDEAVIRDAIKILEKDMQRFDRRSFRAALAEIMGCRPTPRAMWEFAQKHPDRWAQAATILGQLAGFERGVNVNINVRDVTQLPDSELLDEVRRLGIEVKALARGATGEVVDAEIVAALPPVDGEPHER